METSTPPTGEEFVEIRKAAAEVMLKRGAKTPRAASTYRCARRNEWRKIHNPFPWSAWGLSGLRTDVPTRTLRQAPVRPNRSRRLDGLPTRRELIAQLQPAVEELQRRLAEVDATE